MDNGDNILNFPEKAPQPSGGGQPPMEPLEPRIRSLENDVNTIKERLSHMPTKYEMVVWLLGIGISVILILGGMLAKGFGWLWFSV